MERWMKVRYMDGRMYGWKDGLMDEGGIDGLMDEDLMDGRMDG